MARQSNKLWQLDQPVMDTIVERHEAAAAVHSNKAAEIVRFMHATMGYPTIATLRKAIMRGFLQGFPGLTLQWLAKHPPISEATYMGHLKQKRKNVRSTKKIASNSGEQPDKKPDTKTKSGHTAANAQCTEGQRESVSDDQDQQVRNRSETQISQLKHRIEQLEKAANRKGSQRTPSETASVKTTEHTHGESAMNQLKLLIDDGNESGTDEKFPERSAESEQKGYLYAKWYT
jgi:hypothetical protein